MRIGFVLKDLAGYYAHVKPFYDHNKSFEVFILHLDKYYSNRKLYEKINDNVTFIDLSNNYKLKKEILNLELDFLIFFNPGNLFEQVLITICKEIGVKTIYFQHGINPNVEKVGETSKSYISLRKYPVIFRKYLFFFAVTVSTALSLKKWYLLGDYFSLSLSFLWSNSNVLKTNFGTKRTKVDHSFVYNRFDKMLLQAHSQINDDQITISGYPFIEPLEVQIIKGKSVLYISSALRESKVILITSDEELDYYLKLYNEISKTGMELIIKLHPLDDEKTIGQFFREFKNLRIIKDENLANLVKEAVLVIGDYSTALFYAIKYFKPIVILENPNLTHFPFDLQDWGIGIKARLDNLFESIDVCDLNSLVDKDKYLNFMIDFLNSNGQSSYRCFFDKLLELKQNVRDSSITPGG